MSLVNKNLAANFISKSWAALLSVLLFSTYVRFLGLETYGLIGFYNTLLVLITPLDFGFSAATNREIAKLSAHTETAVAIPNFIRTLEWIFWVTAAGLGLLFLCLTPVITTHWLRPEHLSLTTITKSVACMAIAIMFQWPSAFYSSSLMGLQKQVLLNTIVVSFGTLRACGILLLFIFIAPSIEMFFLWQIAISLAQTLALRSLLWKLFPKAKAHFDKNCLKQIKNFALGMSAISLTALILSNLDKIILSKLLKLENFGEYSIVTTIASSVTLLSWPLFVSHFPSLSQLTAKKDLPALTDFYHSGSQKLSLLMFPFSLTVIFFPTEVLTVILGKAPPPLLPMVLSIYMIGSLLNGLMTMPYALQMAIGWTKLPLYQNLIAIPILSTALVITAFYFGTTSAAIIWLILNTYYVLSTVPIMHTRPSRRNGQMVFTRHRLACLRSSYRRCDLPLGLPSQNTFVTTLLGCLTFGVSLLCCSLTTGLARKKLLYWVQPKAP